MIITCDKCGKKFYIPDAWVKIKDLKVYCPHCRKLQEQIYVKNDNQKQEKK